MRRSRSSPFVCPGSGKEPVTSGFGSAAFRVPTARKTRGRATSQSAPQVAPPDLPAWATAATAPSRRPSGQARSGVVVDPERGIERLNEAAAAVTGRAFDKRPGAAALGRRLDPLLTVAQAATILNVSTRTVRRLIASGAIRVVRIGHSVRVEPGEIEKLIARGGALK
jgi:excisionase family DNA binding protein